MGPSFTMKYFFIFKCWLCAKESKLKTKEKQLSHNGGWRTIVFFMKEYLLHNIHSNDNKNQSKIKTQVQTHFITNLGEKRNFKSCLLPMFIFVFVFRYWIHLTITFLLRKLFFFTLSSLPFIDIFIEWKVIKNLGSLKACNF